MIDRDYKKLLLQKNSPISKDIQLKIIDDLFECFIQYNRDMLYIADGFVGMVGSKGAFKITAYQHLSARFDGVELQSYSKKDKKARWNLRIEEIYETLTVRNSFILLSYESDLYAKSQVVLKDPMSKTITVVTNKLRMKEVKEASMEDSEYNEIIEDFKEHFIYFDEFLKLIVDMRLAKDRKASFLHLRVKSNWGKSFLSGLLQNLHIGFEIDYHNLMNKGANDIAPIQVRNSFVLILDEFNTFSAEMKKLSHNFRFAPKFGMTESVPLYLKILMSAEKSISFSGGVDEQIVNRVMVMDINNDEAVRLTDRAIYKKYGNAQYMSALERYAYIQLKGFLDMYLSMDKFVAHRTADIAVGEALDKYRMKVVNLNEEIKLVLNEAIGELLSNSTESMSAKNKELASRFVKLSRGTYKGKILIKQPKKTIENILKNSVSEGDYKKMRYKISDFEDILNVVVLNGSIRVNGASTTTRGLIIELPKLTEEEERNCPTEFTNDFKVPLRPMSFSNKNKTPNFAKKDTEPEAIPNFARKDIEPEIPNFAKKDIKPKVIAIVKKDIEPEVIPNFARKDTNE